MKLASLLLLFLATGAALCGDPSPSDNYETEADQLNQIIADFGSRKQSTLSELKDWLTDTSPSDKADAVVSKLVSDSGSLNDASLNVLLTQVQTQSIDSDFTLPLAHQRLTELLVFFDPLSLLADFSAAAEGRGAKLLASNQLGLKRLDESNSAIYQAAKKLQEGAPKARASVRQLDADFANLCQPAFDFVPFYFNQRFTVEEEFVNSKVDGNSLALAGVLQDQRTAFGRSAGEARAFCSRLDQLLSDTAQTCAGILNFFAEARRKGSNFSERFPEVQQSVDQLFVLRAKFADVLALTDSRLSEIAARRARLEAAFLLAKKYHDSYQLSTAPVTDLTESQQATRAQLTAQHNEDLRDQLADQKEAEQDEAEIAAESKLDLTADQKEARAAARNKRAVLRTIRNSERLQREADRRKAAKAAGLSEDYLGTGLTGTDTKTQSLLDKLKSRYFGEDSVDSQVFFVLKEKENQLVAYAKALEERIEGGDMKLSDVEDPDVADKIVVSQLDKMTASEGAFGGRMVAGLAAVLLVALVA